MANNYTRLSRLNKNMGMFTKSIIHKLTDGKFPTLCGITPKHRSGPDYVWRPTDYPPDCERCLAKMKKDNLT